MFKKILPFGLMALVVVSLAVPKPSSSQTAVLTVSINDLAQAGFTGIARQDAVDGRYKSPVNYFRVNETVMNENPAWGDASNIVAVTITAVNDAAWEYNNSQIQILDLAGRFQARVSRPGIYIAVTGPDREKVEALARILVTK